VQAGQASTPYKNFNQVVGGDAIVGRREIQTKNAGKALTNGYNCRNYK
jgi:hypothetical protein